MGNNDAGQRLDRWLAKAVPLLPAPLAQKYIRLKRVKVNGKGSRRDVRLCRGMCCSCISTTSFLTPRPRRMPFSPCTSPS